MTSPPRIEPLNAPYSEAVADAFDRIMPPGVPPLFLFRTVATNERVLLRMMAGGLLDRGSLTLREREILIDRTCFRCGSEYEWGVHVAFFGPKIGLSEQETRDLCAENAATTSFTAREKLLLHLCDALHDTATVDDGLWAELSAVFTAEQLVELIALTGYYHAISFLTNALCLPLEPFATRFP